VRGDVRQLRDRLVGEQLDQLLRSARQRLEFRRALDILQRQVPQVRGAERVFDRDAAVVARVAPGFSLARDAGCGALDER
jgi:hypothetical protein